ncbi:MAG: glycine cleavage system protein GcvH [Candidatus Calescibacterium sp.]|nr:glycine cleavage system protein GcvH [Candidatus Calescibacterium sp.]MCX7972039.1 glycine cleavage system protein GcvH [bacterium]MDW8194677.1 glycine cleavage system protein GcvH [Candidatus Calescibacterium sp.]
MSYKIPENLLYSEQHEWVMIEDNMAKIGITDFAQKELGDIVYIDVPKINQKVEFMKVCGSIESVKSVSDLYSPVEGIVIDINEEVINKPELLNQDPYTYWIFKVELKNFDKYQNKLMTAEKYKEYIGAS